MCLLSWLFTPCSGISITIFWWIVCPARCSLSPSLAYRRLWCMSCGEPGRACWLPLGGLCSEAWTHTKLVSLAALAACARLSIILSHCTSSCRMCDKIHTYCVFQHVRILCWGMLLPQMSICHFLVFMIGMVQVVNIHLEHPQPRWQIADDFYCSFYTMSCFLPLLICFVKSKSLKWICGSLETKKATIPPSMCPWSNPELNCWCLEMT